MNLFVLDKSPMKAAEYHCDKHVPKMILETAQMLCTARHHWGLDAPYKPAYVNHPCTRWVRETSDNYRWAWVLGFWLGKQYEQRFGKTHKSSDVIMKVMKHSARMPTGLTPFAQAMPDVYKQDDAVDAYRSYYIGEKAYFAKWDRSVEPDWWA